MAASKRKFKSSLLMTGVVFACLTFAPVKEAKAICESNAEVTAAQTSGISTQLGAVTTIIADMQALVASVLPVELLDLTQKITNFSQSLNGGMGRTWGAWEDNMKAQTAQLNTAMLDTARSDLATMDAAQFDQQQLDQSLQEIKMQERAELSEFACVMDSAIPHLTETHQIQMATANAMTDQFNDELLSVSRDVSPEYLAAIYNNQTRNDDDLQMTRIPSSFFNHAHAQARPTLARNSMEYDKYLNVFCNVLENGGRAPCQQNGARKDDDIEISRTIFGSETLDVEGMEDMLVLATTVDNLIGRPRVSTTPESALASAAGQSDILEKRSTVAHLNVAQGIYWDIIGERMPSRTENLKIGEMRVAAGVPENEVSKTPSKYELRQAFIEHVNAPPFVFSLTGGPAKMAQNDLHLKALRLMMINDLNAKMEKMATMFSIQLSNQLSAKEGTD